MCVQFKVAESMEAGARQSSAGQSSAGQSSATKKGKGSQVLLLIGKESVCLYHVGRPFSQEPSGRGRGGETEHTERRVEREYVRDTGRERGRERREREDGNRLHNRR
jgi:hypothetical protein